MNLSACKSATVFVVKSRQVPSVCPSVLAQIFTFFHVRADFRTAAADRALVVNVVIFLTILRFYGTPTKAPTVRVQLEA